MPLGSDERYQVVQSNAFQEAWNDGVAAGWLDPVEHGPNLDFYTNVILPRVPFHSGVPVPDVAANVLAFRFPRSPRSLTYIEIFYSIVEDDRTVILEDIHLLPGADYEL